MTRMLQVPRSRGAVSGLLLVLLGLWGALIPLVGPYFHYAYTPDSAWTLTAGRVWLEIVPGVATFLGGAILLASASRPLAMFGAELAAAAGAWFALGMVIIPLWPAASTLDPGSPAGTATVLRQLEHLGFYTGLGVVIVFVAALALGRLTVVGVRDARLAERGTAVAEPEPVAAGPPPPGPSARAPPPRAPPPRLRPAPGGRAPCTCSASGWSHGADTPPRRRAAGLTTACRGSASPPRWSGHALKHRHQL